MQDAPKTHGAVGAIAGIALACRIGMGRAGRRGYIYAMTDEALDKII